MSLLKLTAPRMRGDEVLRLQQLLAANGHSPGAIDGVFGPMTDGAVRAFQQTKGLAVDGIAGPMTLAALAAGVSQQPVEQQPDDSRFPIRATEDQPPPTMSDAVEMSTTCSLSNNGRLSGRTVIKNKLAFQGATVGVVVRMLDKRGNVLDAIPAGSWGYDGTAFGLFKPSARDERWDLHIDAAVAAQTHSLELLQVPAPKERWHAILAEVQDRTKSLTEAYEEISKILGAVTP